MKTEKFVVNLDKNFNPFFRELPELINFETMIFK